MKGKKTTWIGRKRIDRKGQKLTYNSERWLF